MPVNGVYKNRYWPKLTVVDKANGGKADSLNTGINFSQKDYICGIDADSLLEPDALLKVSSLALDTKEETIAVGGNILPVNGCTVEKGLLTKIQIPKNRIARLQTVEYLRAFMAGRMGWAYINCLLIISGAFGLFKKDRVIEIGGYLTASERYHKDTVGEDMELVVRLRRFMQEKSLSYKVDYAHNANCWTEVPEAFKILSRQRDRWQRGLIDIITFHKRLLFNPSYGRVGLIAFPYFFIFEMVGPLVECQGYIMVVFAALLGLINEPLALMLFVSSVLMGIVISTASLIFAGKEVVNFKVREIFALIFVAFIENFGFRQIVSFFRVTGFISSLKKSKGWGKMERKGFQVSERKTSLMQ
jgi:cellulose synthase/poly-beta-1,6-N-acetylglucosamine synthase-like glycosyltransferase